MIIEDCMYEWLLAIALVVAAISFIVVANHVSIEIFNDIYNVNL